MTTEDIKQHINLADYVRSCGIELKPHGKNDLVGRCSFHNDDTPSLVITPSKQLGHCLGCNKGGSVIDFVMLRESVDVKERLTFYLSIMAIKSAKPVPRHLKKRKKH